MNENIMKTVKELREKSPKRNFTQTFDLIVNLKDIDLKKPESRINEEFVLPKGRGQEAEVAIFSDTTKADTKIFTSADIDKMTKDRRLARKHIRDTEFFLAEAKLMPVIGKALGQLLAPKGKMPKVIAGNVDATVKELKNSVRIKVKDSPVIQVRIGNEGMKDEDVAENIEAVVKHLETRLPQKKDNIKEVLLKLTMGSPVKVVQ